MFRVEMAGLKAVAAQLDAAFEQAVELIACQVAAHRKVIILGIGKSGAIGRKIAATLTSTGTPSVVLHSVDALHGDLGIVVEGDVVLALSYSGETEELLSLLPALKRLDVHLIGMTAHGRSTLSKHSDLVLRCAVPKEACPFNLAPTASTTAMMALGDALAMAILEARGFTQKDFARYHPSGAIGRAMLVRIGDIMRSGDRNPLAPQTMSVQEALLVMTRCRSGSLSVVDAKGRLVGVFTDGDLRRRMSADAGVLRATLAEVMTKNPIRILASALAAEALKIFNERNIDDLIVVDDDGTPVGVVDSQDLPKLKMM